MAVDFMTVTVSVTDLEPVKKLVHEIANAYPTLAIMAHENPEIALFVESIDAFREELGYANPDAPKPEIGGES